MKYKDFLNFIQLLHDNELLEHMIVIGSWAEYVYAESGYLPDFSSMLRTLDIDFMIKNQRLPRQPVNLVTLAQHAGLTVDFDRLTGTTKFYTPDLLEIEFIIEQKGTGDQLYLKTNVGVTAQALRHLSILREHSIQIKIYNISVNVPTPEAYVIHKMIINQERKDKASNDKESILGLMPYMNQSAFLEIYHSLSTKERKAADQFIKLNQISQYIL